MLSVIPAVDELAMYFAAQRIDHRYLKVLIVAETAVAEMLGERSAMRNRFGIGHEFNAYAISQRNAIFHVEEKHRHMVCPKSMCGDLFDGLAETPGLGTNNIHRTFQHDRSTRGRGS
jgi:hypothetical protein